MIIISSINIYVNVILSAFRHKGDINSQNKINYFLIPSSIENNLIYLFITTLSDGVTSKTRFFVVVESRSIFYSSKSVYLQVDWFTGYNGIMIEH